MATNRIKQYRRIQYWENFFLDSAIYSVGQSVGVSYEDGFRPVSAVTGDLFTYMYSEDKPCDSGATNYFFMPEAVKRAYSLFGYGCVYCSNQQIHDAPDAALAQIRRSVDRGVPVLAWGCGGVEMANGNRLDPLPEGCLIGGYDTENQLLFINLYPGAERLAKTSACGRPGVDEDGYTAIHAAPALATTKGLFFLGEKGGKPDLNRIYQQVLYSIPQRLSMRPRDGYFFGEQAFERWASALQSDAYWQDLQTAQANCWDKHCCAYCALCTSIGIGADEGVAGYMRKVADALNGVPEAKAVLPLFQRLRELNQSIWDYQGGFMPPYDRLEEPAYRGTLAAILREMGGVCRRIVATFS